MASSRDAKQERKKMCYYRAVAAGESFREESNEDSDQDRRTKKEDNRTPAICGEGQQRSRSLAWEIRSNVWEGHVHIYTRGEAISIVYSCAGIPESHWSDLRFAEAPRSRTNAFPSLSCSTIPLVSTPPLLFFFITSTIALQLALQPRYICLARLRRRPVFRRE